jgi:hypothetical protein
MKSERRFWFVMLALLALFMTVGPALVPVSTLGQSILIAGMFGIYLRLVALTTGGQSERLRVSRVT